MLTKRLLVMTTVCAATLVGCSDEPPLPNPEQKGAAKSESVDIKPKTESNSTASTVAQLEVGTEPAAISGPDLARICRAAVAALNGQKPSIMKIASNDRGLVRVRYARPSDRKVWTNECRVDGGRVIWRTVDAFGAGTGAGRWRTDPADENVTYKLEGPMVQITTSYSDGSASTESYTLR